MVARSHGIARPSRSPGHVEIGVLAAELHDTLRDPIDCLIAATALTHDAPLVTKDDRIRQSGVVTTIW